MTRILRKVNRKDAMYAERFMPLVFSCRLRVRASGTEKHIRFERETLEFKRIIRSQRT